ncbi:carbohydrate ABC transporter permease [Cohnella sp. 56]|uniref:carbohydrate ABC transporter permease n=1 Tax=Cohnella sp. 56 TaxID=3113722 RepID=UPI0030E96090
MNRPLLTLARRRAALGWIFILPWVLGFLFLFAIPLAKSLRFSFSKLTVVATGYHLDYVGWRNYLDALYVDANFNRILTESVVNMIVNVPLILFFSLFSAVLVNQKFRGRAMVRAMLFLPVILASGAIAAAELSGLLAQAGNTGMAQDGDKTIGAAAMLASYRLEDILLQSGMPESFIDYITGAVSRIYDIISKSGVQILIFLAALQSIPLSMYEVAKMEGATAYETFWKVTLPMVSPLILTNVIYTIIDSFSDSKVTTAITSTAFASLNFGLSSAMSWLYTGMIAVILLAIGIITSRRVFYHN